jgi:glycosyltransferase involved in cell wall biosynthesis
MEAHMKLRILLAAHATHKGPSYTCFQLASNMQDAELGVDVLSWSVCQEEKAEWLRGVVPDPWGRLLGKIWPSRLSSFAEERFLAETRKGDCVYLWSDVSTKFLIALKERGAVIFREKFNGLQAEARILLERVYDQEGLPFPSILTIDAVRREQQQLALVDAIFVANPIAYAGFLKHGISEKKLIMSSYGWDPKRVRVSSFNPPNKHQFTVLFVGTVNFRKGAQQLIDAWIASGVIGRLVFAGPIANEVAVSRKTALQRPDIQVLGWVEDVSREFRKADVFAFPTHEEGGPLVTYEAMGAGLPVLVSPMGAGAIARDGVDGFVIDPFDQSAWIQAIRSLARDPAQRHRFGLSARERANEFTWDKVGNRRRDAILRFLPTIKNGGST